MIGTRRKVLELREKDILTLLQKDIETAGDQSEWCRRKGVNRPYLNKVLHGRKLIGPRILAALKIRTIYIREDN